MPRRHVAKQDRDLGARLRAHRIRCGLSQGELGKRLKLSFQQIQKYEKGNSAVSSPVLLELASIFETTPHDLLGWHDGSKTPKLIDVESFKLAQAFVGLPAPLKPVFRNLFNLIAKGGPNA